MTKIDKLKIDKLIHELGLKYNLSDSIIKEIVDSPDKFAYEKIKELNLDNVNTEEDLDNVKTNFNYYGLGKLYINFASLNRKNKQKENIKEVNNKRWKT